MNEASRRWAEELRRAHLPFELPPVSMVVAARETPPASMQCLGRDLGLSGHKVNVYYDPAQEEIYLELLN